MSTFTEWNGPGGGRGPSTKDVLALIEAYNSMSTALAKHLASTSSDDAHGFKAALDSTIAETENALNAAIAVKADRSAVEELSEKAAETATARLLVQVESGRLVRCVNRVGQGICGTVVGRGI